MKKFKFRFQAVLDLREKELEESELRFAEAQNNLVKAQKDLEAIEKSLEAVKHNIKQNLNVSASLDITILSSYQNYINSLKIKLFIQKNVICEKEQLLEKARQEMLAIKQKKMTLEKLKEKDYKHYLQEIELTERKEIDDIATLRHLRKGNF